MELEVLTKKKDREQVELYFSCRNLTIKDLTSLSDPYLVISMQNQSNNWITIGKTEIKNNTSDPNFAKTIIVDFVFERRQIIKVECRDADDLTGAKYDCLGEVDFRVYFRQYLSLDIWWGRPIALLFSI